MAAVYQELLKTYKPQNIGIYGCSAGGMQTAMSLAWFQKHSIACPRGGRNLLCVARAAFSAVMRFTQRVRWAKRDCPAHASRSAASPLSYFSDTDPKDPLVSPINSPDVLAKFPPTLIITGTRGFELSSALYTHEQLVRLGVETELHVWEGLFHGFFYNVDVPESKDALNVIIKFFDSHLGGSDAR